MKKQLLLVLFSLICIVGYSQNTSINLQLGAKNTTLSLFDGSNQNVKATYTLKECNKPYEGIYAEYAFLAFENSSQKQVTISWKTEAYYNNKCVSCDENDLEYAHTITLSPGEKISGSCDLSQNSKLRVFSKWTQVKNKRVLTKVDIKNLKVEEVK